MRNVPTIIPAQPEHVAVIAANVREADKQEFAVNFRTATQIMEAGLRISAKAYTGKVNDIPVCMFGVAPVSAIMPEHGRPWMVGTKALDEYAVLFLRRCRPQVNEMKRLYPVLTNYVAEANVKAIEWLKWLGFTVSSEPVSMGIRGVPFLHFELKGEK